LQINFVLYFKSQGELSMKNKTSALVAITLVSSLFTLPARSFAQPAEDEGATLESVVQVIRDSLVEAQANNVEGFPPLTSAVIGLNTTVSKNIGGKIKFLIFSIGSSTQIDNSSSLELQMAPPATKTAVSSVDPAQLKQALAQAVNLAKISILNANNGTPKLITKKVTIEIKFAVQHEVSGGIDTATLLPIGLSGTGKLNKNQIHSLKLTFGS
jgi:hypothetical protein